MENLTAEEREKQLLMDLGCGALERCKLAIIFNRKNGLVNMTLWRDMIEQATTSKGSDWFEEDGELKFHKSYGGLDFLIRIYKTKEYFIVKYRVKYDGVVEKNTYNIPKDGLEQAYYKAMEYEFFYDGNISPSHELGQDLYDREYVKDIHLNPCEHFLTK